MTDQLALGDPDDGYLWHYTTTKGFCGIAENKALWATDARFLNDISELTIGPARAQISWNGSAAKYQQAREGRSTPTGSLDVDANELHEVLSLHKMQYNPERDGPIKVVPDGPAPFVTSFCMAGDSLPQWRAYGGSYALGFRRRDLDRALVEFSGDYVLRVRYEAKTGKPLYLTFIDNNYEAHVHPRQQAWIKDKAFVTEEEARMVVTRKPDSVDVHHRDGLYGWTPYVNVPLVLHDGYEVAPQIIRVRPGDEGELRRSADEVLKKVGWTGTAVKDSAIPLR